MTNEGKKALCNINAPKTKTEWCHEETGMCQWPKAESIYKQGRGKFTNCGYQTVLLSCVIDAMEGRDVATIDMPGAFMQADMEDVVHMKLEGKMAELLVRIDPKLYRKHVQMQGGKQVLYVELKKA